MKRVSGVLGVARSTLTRKHHREPSWRDRRGRALQDDMPLIGEIQEAIAELPSYGYRRAWACLRRQREAAGLPAVNVKRVYRVMREHRLLLARVRPPRPAPRRHDGKVAVTLSNQRWCSDGFEFRCDNGQAVHATFALDCADREVMSWQATTGGQTGDLVREVMLAAVEQRFGTDVPTTPIQWLTDNGSPYVARATQSFARDLGLEPLTTPVCSPQSNGMAESLVRTIKRDYVAFMSKPEPAMAMRNLALAFEHYNEHHPHSALKYRSPREYRHRLASSNQA